ncbi:mannosyl-oligosaccharide alpha-1,2-mannosidase IA-like [Ctenocephalides felis]|uniref:mannosyl-oligosaccharide alpha-1,2-mannosidase IA-like n=1 Tax=Ctenocephalides felis TaxID=7515 RepID=UPI000E6E11A0|nr:mannosyl-oligosaccharide alpha-1,2-mannosidase IA-like [Ctenocephalides felis]
MCWMMSNKLLIQLGLAAPNRPMHDAFNQELHREKLYDLNNLKELIETKLPLLNEQQKYVFDTLMKVTNDGTGGIYFLNAPGGTGKTFLILLILATIRSQNKIALALASSGIAATLLEGGQTAHSAIKLPLNMQSNETPTFNITKSFDALNRTLKDQQSNQNRFDHMSLGALGDSFFEYLLKAWLQSGRQDAEARVMYDEAMAAITEKMIKRSHQSGLTYVAELKYEKVEHKMDHLACFAGGLYGLGAQTLQNDVSDSYLLIGEQLAATCHESYDRTPTKLGPESFRFTEAVEARAIKTTEKYYILRPETIESYFVLWRLTKNQKYRDWGWEAVQAIEKKLSSQGGYTGIKNVYLEDSPKDDVQQSFFLAETLKYLYLLFSDDSLIPLDKWVFNTEAHPLPIKGANPLYRSHTATSKH